MTIPVLKKNLIRLKFCLNDARNRIEIHTGERVFSRAATLFEKMREIRMNKIFFLGKYKISSILIFTSNFAFENHFHATQ